MRELMEHVNGISAEDFAHLSEDRDDMENRVFELEEIQQQILELLGEAEHLLQGTDEYDAAKSYWLAHIETALTKEHGYLGGSMHTMQDSIDALREYGYDDEEEEDWDEDEENIPGENDPAKPRIKTSGFDDWSDN